MDDEDEIVVACTAVVVCLGAAMIATKSKKQTLHMDETVYQDRHRYGV